MFVKQKLLQITYNHVWNQPRTHGHPLSFECQDSRGPYAHLGVVGDRRG